MEEPKICVWGDSIAKGVVYDEQRGRYAICRGNCLARMSRELGRTVDNYAVMGNTSAQGWIKMQSQTLEAGAVAVIEFGGNDCDLDWKAASEHPEALQEGRVPLAKFGDNLRQMIRRVRDAGMKPLLVTPPPLIAQRYYEWVCRGLDAAKILSYLGDVEHIYRWQERYAILVRKIAQEQGTRLLDVRDLFLSQLRLTDLMCADGIHPNEQGHALVFEELKGALASC